MYRTVLVSSVAVVLLCATCAVAGPPERVQKPLAKELAKTVSLEFEEAKLSEVLKRLDEQTDLAVRLREEALDVAITVRVSEAPLGEVLELVRDQVSENTINWDIRGRTISFEYDSDVVKRYTTTRTYDIRALISLPLHYTNADAESQQPELDQPYPGCGFGHISDDEDKPASRSDRIVEVMDLIRISIKPDEWRAMGGLTHTMNELNGILYVTAPEMSQDQLAEFLKVVSQARHRMIAMDVRLVAMDTDKVDALLGASPHGPALTPADADKLLRSDELQPLARTSLIGVSGQRLASTVGRESAYVRELDSIVATATRADDPVVGRILSGLTVQVQAMSNPYDASILLNIEANASQAKLERTREYKGTTGGDAPATKERPAARTPAIQTHSELDLPDVDIAKLRARVVVKDGGAVVLAANNATTGLGDEDTALVLIVRPRLIEPTNQ